jgi:hypothetical protein
MVKPATELVCAGFFMGNFCSGLSFQDEYNRTMSLFFGHAIGTPVAGMSSIWRYGGCNG